MRIAPVGLFLSHEVRGDRGKLGRTFEIGMNLAGITHGHPSGYLTAGVLGVITALLVCGSPLMEAVAESRLLLVQYADHEETLRAIDRALELASTHPNSAAAIRKLGEGWVAEEALGIALYCALSAPTFKSGVVLAVNHDGDSDSTGAIAGNLLGCMHGAQAIPPKWLESLELREVINRLADDLASVWECKLDSPAREVYFSRYPPN